MGVFTAESGVASAQRVEVRRFECPRCATVSFWPTLSSGLFDQFSLSALTQPGASISLECPRCPGEQLVEAGMYGCFLPDEPELDALCWERAHPDDDPAWFLLAVDTFGIDDLEPFMARLTGGGGRRPLDAPDEETLEREWGRVLSVRSRWRLLLADAETQGRGLSCIAAPGLRLFASPAVSYDPHEIEALAAAHPPESTARIRLSCNPHDPNGAGVWAGPWAGKLDSSMTGYSLIDCAEVDRRIAQAALQYRLDPLLEAPTDQKQPVVDDETGQPALWFRRGEIALPVIPSEVMTAVALAGTTVAEAAHLVVSQEWFRAELVLQFADHLRAAADELEVVVRHTREVELVNGERALVLDPVRLLSRFGFDPNAPALLAEIERISGSIRGGASRETLLESLLCACGQTRPTVQLRPAGFLDRDPPPHVAQLVDERGREFVLIPALECAHQVNVLFGEGARLLEREGWELSRELQHPDIPDLYAQALEARGISGAVTSITLEGTNIATALALPEMTGELQELLADRFPADAALAGIAPTTHFVVIVNLNEDVPQLPFDNAVGVRIRRGPLPGIQLGFTRKLEQHPEPSRSITLDWQREPASSRG